MNNARRFFVGGNWKLNGTKDSVSVLVSELNQAKFNKNVELMVAPSFLYLSFVKEKISPNYNVAAQNCWKEKFGAFTGETSAVQIRDMGLNWVILGHSERRNVMGESVELVGQKTRCALDAGLSVVFCCGEQLAQRESGDTDKVVFEQLSVLANYPKNDWAKIVIAYEPVWAIGTGKVATPKQAQDTHYSIRKWLNDKVSPEISKTTRIIYGGSVSPQNAVALASQPDIDGFLVGGASLKGPDFLSIISSYQSK
jgi:triosephosphate isomerase